MKLNAKRWSILATGALALSMVGAPTMAATPSATDPVATVNTLLDAIPAKDFTGIADLVCAQYKDEVSKALDLGSQISGQLSSLGPGIDPTAFINGLSFTIDGRDVTLVSNDGTNAVVHLAAQLSVAVDENAAKDLVKQMLVAAGQEPLDAMVDAIVPQLTAQMSTPQPMDQDVTVTLENGAWLVCQSLSPTAEGSPAPSASPAA
ncbi:MAG: hypothetical protein U0869_12220 [Chloroflexota bacterium]